MNMKIRDIIKKYDTQVFTCMKMDTFGYGEI